MWQVRPFSCCFITIILICSLTMAPASPASCQNLSFSPPHLLVQGAVSDDAPALVRFGDRWVVAWKEAGREGRVHAAWLEGKDTGQDMTVSGEQVIAGSLTACSPVLQVWQGRLILFWINTGGGLSYVPDEPGNRFGTEIQELQFTGANKKILTQGFSTAVMQEQLLLAAHGGGKKEVLYTLLEMGPGGQVRAPALHTLPGAQASDWPAVLRINDSVARFCWRAYKETSLFYADLKIRTNSLSHPAVLGKAATRTAPAMVLMPDREHDRLIWCWKGADKDKRICYTSGRADEYPNSATALPGWFSTDYPVSIAVGPGGIGNGSAISQTGWSGHSTGTDAALPALVMAWTGTDGRLYWGSGLYYNPASWMNDLLFPAKGNYTLRDIVLPGSHDAGMSVLSGVGGAMNGTINECNTLTQQVSVAAQLRAGLRMFDLRVGLYNGSLYAKHSSSDCMTEAIGGGYGERMDSMLPAIRKFLLTQRGETVLLTFSHFCEKEMPLSRLGDSILNGLGRDIVFRTTGKKLQEVPLSDLRGKVIVTMEHYSQPDGLIDSCTIDSRSGAFVNFRREYAGTNDLNKLLSGQQSFFRSLPNSLAGNDLVRLDWQLTQSSDEAAMSCNAFESDKTSPLLDGAMLLTNMIRRHQSILDLAIGGNRNLPLKLQEWMDQGIVHRGNRPNIIYVDAAGAWVTDYCVLLNRMDLYNFSTTTAVP